MSSQASIVQQDLVYEGKTTKEAHAAELKRIMDELNEMNSTNDLAKYREKAAIHHSDGSIERFKI